MSTTPSEADKRAAKRILGVYAEYDLESVAQTERIIAEEMATEREAHRKAVEAFGVYGSHVVACAIENNEPCNCGFDKALAAIEKVSG